MFDTYGPFVLHTHDKKGIDQLYEDIRADPAENLQYGIGIYIIAKQGANGELSPTYVGRTTVEFGTRLKQHFEAGKFAELCEEGPLTIFLIARAINGKIVTKDEATGKDLLLIEQLEHDLIDHCVTLNEDLLNVHNRKKRKVYVAGYQGDDASKRESAAQALGKLLNT